MGETLGGRIPSPLSPGMDRVKVSLVLRKKICMLHFSVDFAITFELIMLNNSNKVWY